LLFEFLSKNIWPGTTKISGMASFCKQFPVNKQLIVGGQGIPLEDFLANPAAHWLET
jgi:hypothetical protein